jgi:hypothetical protein
MSWLPTLLWIVSMMVCIPTRSWWTLLMLTAFPLVWEWFPVFLRNHRRDLEGTSRRMLISSTCGMLALLATIGIVWGANADVTLFLMAATSFMLMPVVMMILALF